MPASGGSPFGEFDDLFKESLGKAKKPEKKPEKGLPWHAKSIDGKLYFPIDEVIELLKINNVLPAVRRGLEKHL